MPISAKVDVEKLIPETQNEDGVRRALQESVRLVEAKAKVNVVAMDAVDTGNMLNAIHSKVGSSDAEVISPAPYSIYVHEGTRYMSARPFLRKALEESVSAIKQIFQKEATGT